MSLRRIDSFLKIKEMNHLNIEMPHGKQRGTISANISNYGWFVRDKEETSNPSVPLLQKLKSITFSSSTNRKEINYGNKLQTIKSLKFLKDIK